MNKPSILKANINESPEILRFSSEVNEFVVVCFCVMVVGQSILIRLILLRNPDEKYKRSRDEKYKHSWGSNPQS